MTRILISTLLLAAMACAVEAADRKLPPLKVQPGPQLVVDEHIEALNACDWDRLMAQYPPEVEFILPNGVWVVGRKAIGDVFEGFCKPRAEGGFKGATFIPEWTRTIGDTVNVSWRVEAPWLAEPYKGADAYVTKDGLMYVQVTTFDPADMKLR
jgi:hypothetical protein